MPVHKPMDTEAEALMAKIKFYLKDPHAYAPDYSSLMDEYNKLVAFPVLEFTPKVWDELTDLVNLMMF